MAYITTAPNRLDVVRNYADMYPAAFKRAGKGSTEFVDSVASWLYTTDSNRWGLNGKRGSPVISEDAISYIAPASPTGGVEIIDIIGGSKGTNPTPQWTNVTQDTIDAGSVGKWFLPQGILVEEEDPPYDDDEEENGWDDDPILDYPLTDYKWKISHQSAIDYEISQWYWNTHGEHPTITFIGHINWRAGNEWQRWERVVGAPLTLRKLLEEST